MDRQPTEVNLAVDTVSLSFFNQLVGAQSPLNHTTLCNRHSFARLPLIPLRIGFHHRSVNPLRKRTVDRQIEAIRPIQLRVDYSQPIRPIRFNSNRRTAPTVSTTIPTNSSRWQAIARRHPCRRISSTISRKFEQHSPKTVLTNTKTIQQRRPTNRCPDM